MNEEKITLDQIIQKQEETKIKYEADIANEKQANLSLKKTLADKNDEIFELQKVNEQLAKEKDDWKTEAHRNRKVQAETKQAKEQASFAEEFKKLQAQRGIVIN